MGCNCKSSSKTVEPTVREKKGITWGIDGNTVAKWFMFITMSILSPLMLPFFIVAMYYAIIKNKRLEVIPTLRILLRSAIDQHNKKTDELEELDLDSAEVLEKVVEDVIEKNV